MAARTLFVTRPASATSEPGCTSRTSGGPGNADTAAGDGDMSAGSNKGFMTLVQLRKEEGLKLPDVRRLAESDPTFPPIEWTSERTGLIRREDWAKWTERRFERRDQRQQQSIRRMLLVRGAVTKKRSEDLPDFLRKR